MKRPTIFGTPAYRQLWRVVDGAVTDAFAQHPDYLTDKGEQSARMSVVKRVTGAVHGYAKLSFAGRRLAEAGSGFSPAGDRGDGASNTSAPEPFEQVLCLPDWPFLPRDNGRDEGELPVQVARPFSCEDL